ncbi:MAG TPA: helix-turn-helix domain-containing protein [Flavobacterium sp.]|nr:helix-turn-helix domain-containing protein [Flavobacterium sp.]
MDLIYQMTIYAPTFVTLLWAIVLLLENSTKSPAKHFLGFFMLAATLVYFSHAVYFTKHYDFYLYIDPIYNLASLSVYPLFYWYIKVLTAEPYYDFKNIVHLIPALFVSLSLAFVYFLMDAPEQFLRVVLFRDESLVGTYPKLWIVQKSLLVFARMAFFIQVVVYLYLGMRRIEKYRKLVSNFYSNIEGRDMKWVKWLIFIFSITALVSTISNFLGRCYFLEESFILIIPALVFTVLLFTIGYLGVKQTHTVKEFIKDEDESDLYENLSPFESLKTELVSLFEDENLFKRSDLRINHVGQILNSNRTYISKLINEEFNCSFTDFVNSYRIEEAKKLLKSKQPNLHTLEYIAETSGFSSVGSLIRIFKQFEGITPGGYRKKWEKWMKGHFQKISLVSRCNLTVIIKAVKNKIEPVINSYLCFYEEKYQQFS